MSFYLELLIICCIFVKKTNNMIGIYKIQSKINNKVYIGSSINIKDRINDHKSKLKNNKHSNIHLQNHVNKYNFNDLSFEIVLVINNDKYLREIEQLYLNSYNWKNTFNISKNTKYYDNKMSKKVYQYDKNGKFIKKFNSIDEASRNIYNDLRYSNNIRQCCNIDNNRIICKNYMWSFKKYDQLITKYILINIKNNTKKYFNYSGEIAEELNMSYKSGSALLRRFKKYDNIYKDYKLIITTMGLPK